MQSHHHLPEVVFEFWHAANYSLRLRQMFMFVSNTTDSYGILESPYFSQNIRLRLTISTLHKVGAHIMEHELGA